MTRHRAKERRGRRHYCHRDGLATSSPLTRSARIRVITPDGATDALTIPTSPDDSANCPFSVTQAHCYIAVTARKSQIVIHTLAIIRIGVFKSKDSQVTLAKWRSLRWLSRIRKARHPRASMGASCRGVQAYISSDPVLIPDRLKKLLPISWLRCAEVLNM